jgi:curved DNA-binding protein CbpA
MNNLYDILGVSKDATPEEIKTAYRNLAKIHHPDKGGSEKEFNRIQTAYDVLSDGKRRAKYDSTGRIEKDKGFEEQFFGFVASQIVPIIERADNLDFDLMKKAKKHVSDLIRVGTDNIIDLGKKSKHIEAAIVRCKKKNGGENIMSKILESKLHNIKNVIEQVKEEKAFIEKCLLALDDYDYDFTEVPEKSKQKGWIAIDLESLFGDKYSSNMPGQEISEDDAKQLKEDE